MQRLPAHAVEPGADDGLVLTTDDGEAKWLPSAGGGGGGGSTTHLVPLTTVVDGEPQLIWTADNQLVLTLETS